MFDEVEVEAIVQPGRDENGEEIARLFHARLFRDPAEPARDAENVGIDQKRRNYG